MALERSILSFCINYGVQPEGLYKSLDSVLKEILFFKNIEITLDELDKSKNMLETSLLFNTETKYLFRKKNGQAVIKKRNEKLKQLDDDLPKIAGQFLKLFRIL